MGIRDSSIDYGLLAGTWAKITVGCGKSGVQGKGGFFLADYSPVSELSLIHIYIGREIKQNEQRLSRLDVLKSDLRAWNAAPGDGAFEMLCLEKQLSGYRWELYSHLQLCLLEYRRLQRFIALIDDSLIRQILTVRYVDGKNWNQVALQVGGGNTADSVRKAADRFLKTYME